VQEFVEVQAVEEPLPPESGDGDPPVRTVRPLPDRTGDAALSAWRGDVGTAAIAAAGGLVAGAATVVAARAVRGGISKLPLISRRKPEREVVASRSFLIDVHVLGR
jgi:hypothetical protein